MNRAIRVAIGLALTAACGAPPKTATSVLQDAQKALGDIKTIQFSGSGMSAFVGQALAAGEPWPARELSGFTETINYDQKSARVDLNFAQPTFGGQQQNTEVNGDKAWNVGPNGPAPQLAAAEQRQLMTWLTPHGFVKAGLAAGDAMLSGTETAPVVSFTTMGKYKLVGTFDAQNLLTKIETKRPDPVLGDADVVATFSDYKDNGGVKFPSKIAISEGGQPSWELNTTKVTPNAAADLPVPDAVASATVPPVQVAVATTKIADGVWFLGGGTHHSLVVGFKDYIAVIEAPVSEERSLAVIAEAKKLVPDKPIKYLFTTHHHFDHTGGLRTYAAQGVTIVTNQSNVSYFEKTLMAPATMMPDSQAKNPQKPIFQPVSDKWVLTDGKQTIEVYATDGDTHTKEYTLIYLPKSKVLVEADAFSPGPANAPPPSVPAPNAVKLYDEIQRLKLNVATIAPIHGRGPVPFAELAKAVGKKA